MSEKKSLRGFQKLLDKAIGDRKKADFAKEVGLTPAHLSRLLNQPEISVPSNATLRKIANASQGRVSYELLQRACESSEEPEKKVFESRLGEVQKKSIDSYRNLKDGLLELSRHPFYCVDIPEFFSMVNMLYSSMPASFKTEDPQPIENIGKAKPMAEQYVNVTASWGDEDFAGKLGFVLYFCKTTGGHCFITGVAMDLQSLIDTEHPMGMRRLMQLSEEDNPVISDYHTVTSIRYLKEDVIQQNTMLQKLKTSVGITDGMTTEERTQKWEDFWERLRKALEEDEKDGSSDD